MRMVEETLRGSFHSLCWLDASLARHHHMDHQPEAACRLESKARPDRQVPIKIKIRSNGEKTAGCVDFVLGPESRSASASPPEPRHSRKCGQHALDRSRPNWQARKLLVTRPAARETRLPKPDKAASTILHYTHAIHDPCPLVNRTCTSAGTPCAW